MKKSTLILLTVFTVANAVHGQNFGWKDISVNIPEFPYDTVATLTDVFFVNDNEGWITTNHSNNDTAAILHTTDGGETFEVQTTQYSCNAIHMLNENVGYAGGKSGLVYRTTNGGENWIAIGSISATLADISFPPMGDTGYCCGINGNIHSIDSSGVTKMISNVNGHLYSISFPVTSEEGWVCGGDVIRHFTNGIWSGDQNMPSGGYNAIYMVDSLNGWIVGDGGIIAHTENGWNWVEQTNPDPDSQTLYDVFFLNNNEGCAVGIGGTIIRTTNGGITWLMEAEELTTKDLKGVYFNSSNNGYVVGNGKTLLRYNELSGIGNIELAVEFELFPNPVKDKLQITCSDLKNKNGSIEILSLDGKIIIKKEIETGIENIGLDLKNLKSGMYFCKITIDKKSSTKKLIIE